MVPLETFESASFKKLVNVIRNVSRCSLPSADDLGEQLHQLATHQKDAIKEQLKLVNNFCLAEEIRQPWHDGKCYAIISMHYIKDWSYRHRMLLCKQTSSTQETFKLNTMESFQLEYGDFESSVIEKIICNLSERQSLPGFLDGSAPITRIIGQEKQRYNNSFTNELGNAVVRALADTSQTHIALLFKKAAKLLTAKAFDGAYDSSVALEWFEQMKLLKLVVMNSEELERETENVELKDLLLNSSEVQALSTILQMLESFREVVEHFRFAGAKTCTASLAVPYHRLLLQTLTELRAQHPNHSFLECLSRYFIDCTDFVEGRSSDPTIYTTATTLDPRFKLRWCDDTDYELYKNHIADLARRVVECKTEPTTLAVNGTASSIFAKILKQPSESHEDAAIATEVLRYLREPIIAEDRDVLDYWKQNEANFPNLSVLASKYLAIPTSSADIKDLYPLDSNILVNNSSLSGNLLENIVELGSNISNS